MTLLADLEAASVVLRRSIAVSCTEEISSSPSRTDIPVLLPPPGVPHDETGVGEDDMGKNGPNTINCINTKTNNVPSGHERRIKVVDTIVSEGNCNGQAVPVGWPSCASKPTAS
ncbi:uncharacterized protein MAM_01065 [Metarhizium album ARSEF 1941]|uniref:Uncharacterized protein n=1 Tax=Metarhizium album (strain ARSEF 1941) TaxID=1081103 RepID=A0A0B2X6P5_METAS|nr:uncharacterized protein MAM_01065 [Metarhizium album ARSEF 1941]KHO02064.1 hypothetical protein MAM_01065 [Metarhizium album ARSEF 1941]